MAKEFSEMTPAEKAEHAATQAAVAVAASNPVDKADLSDPVKVTAPGFDDPTPDVEALQNKILALTVANEVVTAAITELEAAVGILIKKNALIEPLLPKGTWDEFKEASNG